MRRIRHWDAAAVDAKERKFFKELGQRLTEARKRAGMTQVELAQALQIPQQNLARYELGQSRISLALLTEMSAILRFSLDEMLLLSRIGGRGKRGPASKLELQIEAVTRLPKSKQRVVEDMIEGVLARASRGNS